MKKNNHKRMRRRLVYTGSLALVLVLGIFCIRFVTYRPDQTEQTGKVEQSASPESVPALETVQPTVTAQPIETVQPTVTAQPIETVQPTETAQPIETAQPTVTAQPTETAQPAENTASLSPPAANADTIAEPLWLKVSVADQNVIVYDANDQIVHTFICSTGLDGAETETPTGTYTIQERGESFFSQTYQQGAYYWTQFYGDYLFHSVPFDKDRNIEAVEAIKLGTKASHGCVRLSIEDAKWIYDNIPRGTVVVIE